MARTDGNHKNISKAAALAHTYRCRDCGKTTGANGIGIMHRQLGGGTKPLLLSATTYDPISEDEAVCGNCESHDLIYLS
jgi:hypothetical protein